MAATDARGSSRIFISYRREDSAGHVLALLPALKSRFGANQIFKDTDSIPPGVDFVKFIRQELETCPVMLAIIGRNWLTIHDPRLNARRLDDQGDYLRLEVATALANERVRVIPVLVGRSVMPGANDLPPDLAPLALRNAFELSDTRWEADVQRLIEAIELALPAPPLSAADARSRPAPQDAQGRTRESVGQGGRADPPQVDHDWQAIDTIPSDPITLTFTGADHKRLSDALEKAFPTYQELEMMVRYRLGLNLESIVARVNRLSYVTFELVRTQLAAGLLLRLMAAARASQPDNPQLALASEPFGLAMSTPPRSELEEIVRKSGVPFDVAVWRERLAKREKCVCRIDVTTSAGTAHGSGFLVGPDLVLTNHHVVAPMIVQRTEGQSAPAGVALDPSRVTVRFDEMVNGNGTVVNPGLNVALASDWLVDASPHSAVDLRELPREGVPDPDELDHALIRLAIPVGELPVLLGEAEPGAKERGWMELREAAWSFAQHKAMFIVQRPSSAPMKLTLELDADPVVNANGTRVRYRARNEEGSSGSPCFNQFWDVVALHHVGDPSYAGFNHAGFGEAIPIDRIVTRLRAKGVTGGLTIV